ncbi:MAG: helix-turn-helix transcriptional regulator [Polyangiaceae bacterium]
MYEALVTRLAERVQQLRKNLGMTQAALAARAGVTVETVARLERVVRGRSSANSNPSLETLSRLAIALEIELHELLAPEPVAPKKDHHLSYLLDGASAATRQRILRVAETLLREEQTEVRHSSIRELGKPTRGGQNSGNT